MIKVEEYILFSKNKRQKHINLSEKCIDRGGGSREFRGLLAAFLDTTIPLPSYKIRNIHLCHACNNSKCSNPHHLYWGTPKENYLDAEECGSAKSIWERSINKFGKEEAIKRVRYAAKIAGQVSSKHRKQRKDGTIGEVSERVC